MKPNETYIKTSETALQKAVKNRDNTISETCTGCGEGQKINSVVFRIIERTFTRTTVGCPIFKGEENCPVFGSEASEVKKEEIS